MHWREVCDALRNAIYLLQNVRRCILEILVLAIIERQHGVQLLRELRDKLVEINLIFENIPTHVILRPNLLRELNDFQVILSDFVIKALVHAANWETYKYLLCNTVLFNTVKFKREIGIEINLIKFDNGN